MGYLTDTQRLDRQLEVHNWCRAAFGDDHAKSIEQRGLRHAEEAIECAQAAGCDPATLHKLIDHIYAKPAGELGQEIGGSGVTLLALAHAAGLDADAEEDKEVRRVKSMPLEHFAKRNAEKNAAGFNVLEPHVLYRTSDPDRPDQICDANGEVVLALCRVCGKCEAELEATCPGPR